MEATFLGLYPKNILNGLSMKITFNDKAIQALKPKKTRYLVQVAGYTGLVLRVNPINGVEFTYRYTVNGIRRWLTLGRYPDMSVADAGVEYSNKRKLVKSGVDPIEQRIEEKRQIAEDEAMHPLLSTFADTYLEAKGKILKNSTLSEYRRIFDRYILRSWPGVPNLAETKISDLRRRDIKLLIDYVATKMPNTYRTGKSGKKTKGAPTQANRCLAVLSGMCRHALELELIENNPALGITKPGKRNPRERYLTMDEVGAVGRVLLNEAPRDTKDAAFIALYTGQRMGQIAGFRMAWRRDGWIEFPSEIMKGGREHRIPEPPQVKVIIDNRKKEGLTTDFVFPGRKDNDHIHPQSLKRGLERLHRPHETKTGITTAPMTKAGVTEAFTFHDFRRTLSTHLNRLGFHGLDSIILAHSAQGVTDVFYQRYKFDDEIKKALILWGEAVQRAIDGTYADIIPITQRQ